MDTKMSFTSRDEGKMVAYKLLSKFTNIGDIRIFPQCICVIHTFMKVNNIFYEILALLCLVHILEC